MAEDTKKSAAESTAAEPPAGGRQDHEAMRAAASRRVDGPASTATLAAGGGGVEVPGGETGPLSVEEVTGVPAREPIPGERDATTLTHREPGAIGGQFAGADTPPPERSAWLDRTTAFEHALEGGGRPEQPE